MSRSTPLRFEDVMTEVEAAARRELGREVDAFGQMGEQLMEAQGFASERPGHPLGEADAAEYRQRMIALAALAIAQAAIVEPGMVIET